MNESAQSKLSDDIARFRRSPAALAAHQNAQQHLRHRRFAPALAAYQALVRQFPSLSQLWTELGMAAAGELEFARADQAFQRAMELAPADIPSLVALGAQYCQMRRLEQGCACFERAIALDPSSVPPRLHLAWWLERRRRLDEALECVEACLARHPKDGRVKYGKAFLLHRKGLNAEAETILRGLLENAPLLPLDVQSDVNHLLAVVLDAAGEYAGALKHLVKSKDLRRQTLNVAALENTYEQMAGKRRELLAQLTPEIVARWREEAAPCPHPLVLLGGAPRSGTTLIEQILGAHPEIIVFDEALSFTEEVMDPLHPSPLGVGVPLKSLRNLAVSVRARLIARYFKSLLRDGPEPPASSLLLDKNPSVTGMLQVWLRLFPGSKVIIALRDPRDILISSYFQNISPNAANINFLSLERTARLYADTMDVWLRFRELGGFDWIETRYENVVENLEKEGRRIMSFLNMPWHENQVRYHETARHKFLNAPTYNEVTKPVHDRAVGRWKHYAAAMEPIKPVLEKYCTAFGYG